MACRVRTSGTFPADAKGRGVRPCFRSFDRAEGLAWANAICWYIFALGLVNLLMGGTSKGFKSLPPVEALEVIPLRPVPSQPALPPPPRTQRQESIPSVRPDPRPDPVPLSLPVKILTVPEGIPTDFSTPEPSGRSTDAVTAAPPDRSASATSAAGMTPGGSGEVLRLGGREAMLYGLDKDHYPALARARREEGTVWLLVAVNAQGRAISAEIKKTSGSYSLDQAALTAARDPRSRYPRGRAGLFEIPVEFSLRR